MQAILKIASGIANPYSLVALTYVTLFLIFRTVRSKAGPQRGTSVYPTIREDGARMKQRSLGTLTFSILVVTLVVGLPLWPSAFGQKKNAGCKDVTRLSDCPITGCADPKMQVSDAANYRAKQTIPPADAPLYKLSLDDFASLQKQADKAVGENRSIKDRRRLTKFEIASGPIGEGALIQIEGYVVGWPNRPSANKGEGVNCGLTGVENNDFHIPIAGDPDETEYDGIVVEMIPQKRSPEWTVRKLRLTAKEERQVVVRGQLFYDNKHRVNDDEDHDLNGQPKRFSLWEVHPVTEFYVCLKTTCDPKKVPTGWTPLERVTVCGRALCAH